MLQLATNAPAFSETTLYSVDAALCDHYSLIDSFISSHRIRNLAGTTIKKEERFLREWFDSHGPPHRPLFVWEAMNCLTGRKLVVDYGKALLDSGVTTHTVRSYLGTLRRFLGFVLEHPVLLANVPIRIQDKYSVVLTQPVSEFDMPRYVYEGERAGIPLDPERLYEFYSVLRLHYLGQKGHIAVQQRNYAMAVLAGESGLRVDELIHLEFDKDLFFDSKKLQTRHAKAAKGSGKRSRITLFPPLARDTIKFYLGHGRKSLASEATPWLFPSKTGKKLAYATAQSALKDMTAVARQQGLPVCEHMSWHWFRRIFATRFIESFPSKLPVLIDLLGHMSPNTVHRYIRHSEGWMDEQIQSVLEGL